MAGASLSELTLRIGFLFAVTIKQVGRGNEMGFRAEHQHHRQQRLTPTIAFHKFTRTQDL
eukprot:scaffold8911_cov166-Amphora_coffeaeformis.AAC.5